MVIFLSVSGGGAAPAGACVVSSGAPGGGVVDEIGLGAVGPAGDVVPAAAAGALVPGAASGEPGQQAGLVKGDGASSGGDITGADLRHCGSPQIRFVRWHGGGHPPVWAAFAPVCRSDIPRTGPGRARKPSPL